MNVYLDLAKLKAELGRTEASVDAILLRTLNRSSRIIDKYTSRVFYTVTETRKFRTKSGSAYLFLPDLISITSITADDIALTADTDYELEPLNGYPKTALRLLSGTFSNRQDVEITGVWGYNSEVEASGATCGTISTTTETTLTPSSMVGLSAGQTWKIEDEQVYVESVGLTTATVKRGVNGTTAATHSAKAISIVVYPDGVAQACLTQAIRFIRGKDAAYGDQSGIDVKTTYYEPSVQVRVLLNPFKRTYFGDD